MTERKKEVISVMFDKLAPDYDRNNNIISLFTHKIIKYLVVASVGRLPKNVKILDLCTGTGDIAGLLKRKYKKANVIGVDFSKEMLNIARKKYPKIDFVYADCMDLPFQNGTFDLATISFGLRNTENYEKTISEIKRVLKNGGIFVHLDFDKKSRFANFIFEKIVKTLKSTDYEYLLQSKNDFPDSNGLIDLFASQGFNLIKTKSFLFGIISAQYLQNV